MRLPLLLALVACSGVRVPPAAPAPQACPTPQLPASCGPAPAAPHVDWVSPGCPPRFGACLTGPDSAALSAYLQASRQWMTRCSDGR